MEPMYASVMCDCYLRFRFFCRYSLFIPLYPVGMLVEMVLMAKSLPYLKSQKLNSIALPNAVNFGFDYRLFIQVPYLSQQLTVAVVAAGAAVAGVIVVVVSVPVSGTIAAAATVAVAVAVAVAAAVTVYVAVSAAVTVCVAVAAAESG